jgi:penicillin-binding protein 1A
MALKNLLKRAEGDSPKGDKSKKKTPKTPKGNGRRRLSKRSRIIILVLFWLMVFSPYITVLSMLQIAKGDDLPSMRELEDPKTLLASEVYTADGKMIGKYFKENRTNAAYNQISTHVVDCLIATEDERFHDHSGVDIKALGRVIDGMVSGNSSAGGGSTISQQLAKMLFPRERNQNTWKLVKRKFKEWIIASRIEQRYTKEEIITMYLNKFDFLNNAVGITSAARVYFDTTPDSLKIEQAAMLVGMAKNPSLFNPLKDSTRTKERRNVVLAQLLKNEHNSKIRVPITRAQFDSLKELPLGIDYRKVDHQEGQAPYFREILREEVTAILEARNLDGTFKCAKKDGSGYNIYQDGLRIYTTIDSRMQTYGENAVRRYLKETLQPQFEKQNKRFLKERYPFARNVSDEEVEKLMYQGMRRSERWRVLKERGLTDAEIRQSFETPVAMKIFDWKGEIDTVMTPKDSIRWYKQFLQAGMMSMDPHTGYVKAWVGGIDFYHFKYDHVKKARRQVGSTFKPFVYATAMHLNKIQPCDEVPNIEYCCEIPFSKNRNKMWCPSNAGAAYSGEMVSMKRALAASMNNITAYVMSKTGPVNVVKFVEALGLEKGYLDPVPSLALGIADLSVWEMVGAQASFVNKGVYIEPVIVTRIEDKNGNVIYDHEPKISEAFSEEVAYLIVQLMKGVVDGGTATGIRYKNPKEPWGGIKHPMAGKTGTTQNGSDGWFMGLTPDLVTGVWVGAEDRAVHFPYIDWGQGGRMALPIYGYYMNDVYNNKSLNISTQDFEKPESLLEIEWDCNKVEEFDTNSPFIDAGAFDEGDFDS